MTVVTPKFGMGASVRRVEDNAFLGQGRYTDEIPPDGMRSYALGIKGAGDAGTIGATLAALCAVTDALYRGYGIRHIDMPATPSRIWGAMQDAGMQ